MRIGPLGVLESAVLLATILVVLAPLFLLWRIFGRAGFPGMLSLLLLLPGVGLVAALAILAFVRWPTRAG